MRTAADVANLSRTQLDIRACVMKSGISAARREEIFTSPERIDVAKRGTTSTRYPVFVERQMRIVHAWGGYERVALQMLEHLWRVKLVTRWKSQPFDLAELGGPRAVPDVLVELACGSLHVIQVRAKRFLTREIEHRYEIEREFLEPLGFRYHVWTNHDVLSSKTSHTVAELDRGRMFPAPLTKIEEIRKASLSATLVGELLDQFGWDDVLSAAACLAFQIDITEPIHEDTPILRNHSPARYRHLFEPRNAAHEWWSALDTAQV
jgi:hypothetical protein